MKPNRFAFLLESPSLPNGQHFIQTSILHSTPLAKGPSDLYFFPPREPWSTTPSRPKSIFLFLPGNPGLLSYYIPFLTTLSLSPTFPPNCAILALAHIGHSPHLEVPQLIGLDGVVESELAVVDELLELVGTEGKLGLSAHSMGCWISVELLKARPQISSLTLLFPTISNIAKSPNGRMLWPLFTSLSRSLVPTLSYLLRPLLPFTSLPAPSKALVRSPATIASALHLARNEMDAIQGADWEFLRRERSKIFGYWGVKDGWVDEEEGRIGREILGGEQEVATKEEREREENGVQRIWHCVESIPHAFCLEHGEIMAHKIAPWVAQTLA
ncbi:hypothetical protein BDY24DRAFT_374212 [Mrakia frigida]|uniref:bifunctional triacylglycerol lipase/ester hydrolase n=1 Tax=Mrakia frigida TaxID=29902 RepID=UPI003FCC1B60